MDSDVSSKIIVPANSHWIVPFLSRIYTEFQQRDYNIEVVPGSKAIAGTAEASLPEAAIHRDWIQHEPKSTFRDICEKYGIENPRGIVFPHMVYEKDYDKPSYRPYWLSGTNSIDYDPYLDDFHRALDYMDMLYEDGKGGIPLQYQGARILRPALQRVADHHGFPSVRASFSPLEDMHIFRSTEEMKNLPIERASYDDLTDEELEAAEEFWEAETNNQNRMIGNEPREGSILEAMKQRVQAIRRNKPDIIPTAMSRLGERALRIIAKRMYLNEEQSWQVMETNNYVFYSIQFPKESRITMRAPQFYNQLWLIEYLSRSLPANYELVVKDHPQRLGALPLSQIRAITRYAKGVAPTIPARKVITQADAVVTLNNTVGYEAIMHGKPVLTLGDAFYSGAGYTRDVTDIQSLPRELKAAVSSDGLSKNEVIEFVHGILRSSYEGTWGDTDEENIKMFADSISKFLNEKNMSGSPK